VDGAGEVLRQSTEGPTLDRQSVCVGDGEETRID
jgi:hypothetical protein